MEITSLIAIAAAFFVIAASPGPATIACAAVSMSQGRRAGLEFGAGLALGLAFWGGVAATGLGAILQASEPALMALKLFGGLYLIWLAVGSARSATAPAPAGAVMEPQGDWFLRGMLLNLSNPKAVVAWMAVLSLGMARDQGPMAIFLATLTCALLGALCYASYALAFSIPGVTQTYRGMRRWVDGAVAGMFAIAGLALIRSALVRSP